MTANQGAEKQCVFTCLFNIILIIGIYSNKLRIRYSGGFNIKSDVSRQEDIGRYYVKAICGS